MPAALPLSGKNALVTGGSRNIGRGIAERLASDGAGVAIGYHGSSGDAEDALAALRAAMPEDGDAPAPTALRADLSDSAEAERLFDEAADHFGAAPTVLVHNAGAQGHPIPFADTEPEDLAQFMDINARGSFYVLREAARRLPRGGRIVAVTSSVTRQMPARLGAYSASKAAANAMVQTLAKEVGERGITVNGVMPGPTKPEEQIGAEAQDAEDAKLSVFGRVGRPADVAPVAAFLAREEARWVTGNLILASGGAYL